MNEFLLRKLVERNIVKRSTEIDAVYKGLGISGLENVETVGTFLVMEIVDNGTEFLFEVADVIDGRRRKLPSGAIRMIDGMEPTRLATIYGLSDKGEPLRQGKRRGRKPKALLAAMAQAAAQADAEAQAGAAE